MPNRLAESTSPYLLQHAENPVDWFPWGEEAFERAKAEDKPIFLSLGYSTCHWCHVMEHQSFEDGEVAAVLNASYVSIKVDREQMLDVDHYYMAVTQAMTGRGGWPNTILMTPERKPFYAGTYFPKSHLLALLHQVAELWHTRRGELEGEGQHIAEVIRGHLDRSGKGVFDDKWIEKGVLSLLSRFDPVNGGFGGSPKFPSPANLQLLFRAQSDQTDERKLEAVSVTLTKMRLGGIYDQLGFGFHRYSTEAVWRIPHFEKMLYDQAGLVQAYLEGFQVTGEPLFRQTVEEVLTYVDRDLSDPAGGFHCAEDADSEGVEGKFYLWTAAELRDELGPEDATFALTYFRATAEGNYREETTGHATDENVLERIRDIEDPDRFERIRARLFEARSRRIRPFKDDKVLADWNGMMIAAFAQAGAALDEPKWISRARRAADLALSTIVREDGGLWHQYRDGRVEGRPTVDDYAHLTLGLVELYQACFETKYLAAAKRLASAMVEELWDEASGGFFLSAGNEVPARAKVGEDGAYPSGNAAAALALAKLGRLLGDSDFEERARQTIEAFAADVARVPEAYVGLLIAADFLNRPGHEVVIVGDRSSSDTKEMLRSARAVFSPRTVFLLKDAASREELAALVPATRDLMAVESRATAYICRNSACELPTADIDRAVFLLQG